MVLLVIERLMLVALAAENSAVIGHDFVVGARY